MKKLLQTAAFKWFLALVGLAGGALGPWGMTLGWRKWSELSAASSSRPPVGTLDGGAPAHAEATPRPAIIANDVGSFPPLDATSLGPTEILLADVFRFDLTREQVASRWPQVTTGLSDLRLQGYRVSLVTGTDPADLAGALTYYFNPRQQVQRIKFQGTTGDGRELVRLLTHRFGFEHRVTNNPSLIVYEAPRREGQSEGLLRMKSAPLLNADQPLQRYDVSLVIERPSEKSLTSRILGPLKGG